MVISVQMLNKVDFVLHLSSWSLYKSFVYLQRVYGTTYQECNNQSLLLKELLIVLYIDFIILS